MQARAFGQPRREPRGQVVGQRCGVGIQVQGAARTMRERLQFAAQLRLLLQDQACMVGEGGAGFGQADAARVPVQQASPASASIVRRRSLAEPVPGLPALRRP
jgi:hypothetical protein